MQPAKRQKQGGLSATLSRAVRRPADWTWSEISFLRSVSPRFIVLCAQVEARPWPEAAGRPCTGLLHLKVAHRSAVFMSSEHGLMLGMVSPGGGYSASSENSPNSERKNPSSCTDQNRVYSLRSHSDARHVPVSDLSEPR